jgi:Peptidase family M48
MHLPHRKLHLYNHPFKFYLVHETHPNAFATPGGNIYVVDSLLYYFVKNTEQLAGTLCHEVSHTIHHDTTTADRERGETQEAGSRGSRAFGAQSCLYSGHRSNWKAAFLKLFPRCRATSGPDRLRYLCLGRLQPLGAGLAVPELQERATERTAAAPIRSSGQSAQDRSSGGIFRKILSPSRGLVLIPRQLSPFLFQKNAPERFLR